MTDDSHGADLITERRVQPAFAHMRRRLKMANDRIDEALRVLGDPHTSPTFKIDRSIEILADAPRNGQHPPTDQQADDVGGCGMVLRA